MSTQNVRLGDVFDIVRGGSPRPIDEFITDQPDGLNWIMIGDAVEGDKYIRATRKKIKPEGLSRTRQVQAGDLLLTNSMSFGHPYIMATSGCIHDGWLALRPRSEIDFDYFYHLLGSTVTYNKFCRLAAGAVVKNLNKELVAAVEVPVPSLPEQRRIAALLDQADGIRRKRREAIVLAESFLRSAFLEMFGDPVGNPMGWEVVRFDTVGQLDRGKSQHRPRNDPSLLGGPYPLIQTGEVAGSGGEITEYTRTYSELGLAQSRMWPAGTLCITIAANIAKTGILRFDACFPDSVVGFTPGPNVSVEFVRGWLAFLQPILEASAPQSAQKNINLEILGRLDIPVPPQELQKRYTALVQAHRGMVQRLERAKAESEELFDALVAEVFKND